MIVADALLSRLDKVRQRAPDQWSARCPAYHDKGPSLSIKALPDGRILVHDFGGCSVDEVLGAVGLSVRDLFPPKPPPAGGAAPLSRRRLLTAGQALEILVFEATLAATAACNIAEGLPMAADDRARLLKAAGRIIAIAEEVAA